MTEVTVLPPNEPHPLRTQAYALLNTIDWQEPEPQSAQKESLDSICDARTLYVCVDKGEVVATALVKPLPPKNPSYFMSGVAVAESYRGQGLAKAILKQITLDYQGGFMYLTAYPHNHGFWQHMGWSRVGQKNLFCKELPSVYPS